MGSLPIVKYPHPALTTRASEVEHFDAALHSFLDDMAATMYEAQGVGLAANQVAVLQRVIVIDTAKKDEASNLLEIVNPTIVHREGKLVWEEGCLSFPELYVKVDRAAKVVVHYQNRLGEMQEIEAEQLLAVALQHEIDHIDGIVFLEHQKPFQRKLALKRFEQTMARRKADGIEDVIG